MVLLIHVLLMYCMKACKVSVTAFVSSQWRRLGFLRWEDKAGLKVFCLGDASLGRLSTLVGDQVPGPIIEKSKPEFS